MRPLRVASSLAEITQQIHSFLARGVRSFQAACVAASESRALRKSNGALCTRPGLLSFFNVMLCRSASCNLQ
jgi:hypothetical protein